MVSPNHLKTGDAFPEIPNDNKLRLLSMRFCPYAQRIHLVLDAKQIPYHTVNINLKQKPEWLTQYSPLGKVPALGLTNETNVPFIYESLIVADYLDEKYPQVPLYPNDPLAKTFDRLWIERFDDVIKSFYRAAVGAAEGASAAVTEVSNGLQKYEEELKKRGSLYFGGSKPGMLDYMIWPWIERFAVLKLLVPENLINREKFPLLILWNDNMIKDSAVQNTYVSAENHLKFIQGHKAGTPDYDMLLA